MLKSTGYKKMSEFGLWVKEQFSLTGLTWKQFEKVTGFGEERLRIWGKGKTKPRLESFVMLCELFARYQKRALSEIVLEGLSKLPEYQGALRRGSNGCL